MQTDGVNIPALLREIAFEASTSLNPLTWGPEQRRLTLETNDAEYYAQALKRILEAVQAIEGIISGNRVCVYCNGWCDAFVHGIEPTTSNCPGFEDLIDQNMDMKE